MTLPPTNYFDAHLPGVSQSIRIASFHDAKVFMCRWTIRDKDPALKTLLRHMDQARSSATADSAMLGIKTDAHLTRNVSHAPAVAIFQQDQR